MKSSPVSSITENLSYKIVALLITLILWVIILGNRDGMTVKKIPVEFLLPKSMVLTNQVPHEVMVKAVGSRSLLKRFSDSQEPITVDLTQSPVGLSTYRLLPDSVNAIAGVKILSLNPALISARIEEVSTRLMTVEPVLVGSPKKGYVVKSVSVEPLQVEIQGGRMILSELSQIKTQAVSITDLEATTTRDSELDIDRPGFVTDRHKTVKVTVVVERKK